MLMSSGRPESLQHGPLVSICIPCYNEPVLAARAVQSAMAQSYEPVEIVVTDDSTDDRVAEAFQRFSDSRLRYFRNRTRFGQTLNWNEAVRLSKGQYVIVLHHDDCFLTTDAIGVMVGHLIGTPDAVMVACSCTTIDESGRRLAIHRLDAAAMTKCSRAPSRLYWANRIGPPSVVMFRKVEPAPYENRLGWLVDVEFYVRYLRRGRGLAESRVLVGTGDQPGRVTAECIADPTIELRELIWLYCQHTRNRSRGRIVLLAAIVRSLRRGNTFFRLAEFAGAMWLPRAAAIAARAWLYGARSIRLILGSQTRGTE